MFAGGATPSGFQFTSIEFSNSPSFPVGNTAILYAGADGIDYDSGSTYEIHWSNGLTGWVTALFKLINIFGDGSVTKNVYIKFDLKLFTFTKSIKSWNPLFGAVDQQAWLPSAIFTAVGSSPWTG